jgi:hypothetical protein
MRQIAIATVAGCFLALTSTAMGAEGPGDVPVGVGGGSGDSPFGKAKVRTDGTLTIGQQETLFVKRIPRKPKLRLAASVSPPYDATPECFQFNAGFCLPEPLFGVPGTPRMRASSKGRASLTFVMPGAVLFENFNDPIQSHPVSFTNGEAVEVEIEGTFKVRHGSVTGPLADTRAVAEVPSSP